MPLVRINNSLHHISADLSQSMKFEIGMSESREARVHGIRIEHNHLLRMEASMMNGITKVQRLYDEIAMMAILAKTHLTVARHCTKINDRKEAFKSYLIFMKIHDELRFKRIYLNNLVDKVKEYVEDVNQFQTDLIDACTLAEIFFRKDLKSLKDKISNVSALDVEMYPEKFLVERFLQFKAKGIEVSLIQLKFLKISNVVYDFDKSYFTHRAYLILKDLRNDPLNCPPPVNVEPKPSAPSEAG